MILIEPPRSPAVAKRNPLNKRELARFAKQAIQAAGASGDISILLTNDERLRELNQQFRKKNKPTDVLSFSAVEWSEGRASKHLGDLAISLDTAANQAESFGHSLATEVKILILHGTLHLAGYDHEQDQGDMALIEARLRKEFDLPATLIERTTPTPTRLAKSRKLARKPGSAHP
jgi:probable rRNA maturation factor